MHQLDKTILRISTAIAFISFLPVFAQAEDAARLINKANAAVRAGDIDAALADYQQAAAVHPHQPELQYNQAVAFYRKGDVAQARQLFLEAVTAGDAHLAGQARYNLANCDYADAVKISEQDKPAAIEKLRSAISHYRGALESNSSDADARANIELANMLIQQLREQQQQQEQPAEDQQNEDQQNKDQGSEEQQQDQQDKDQQGEHQQKQDQQNNDRQNQGENSEQNESGKQDQPQSQDSQKQDQESDSSKDQNEQNQQSQQDQQDQSPSADQQEQQDSQTGNPEDSKDEQSQAQPKDAGKNRQAQTAGAADETDVPAETNSAQMVDADDKDRPMTKEEAQKMLQAVRDRDLLRRMKRLQDQRSRHIPVDRDW